MAKKQSPDELRLKMEQDAHSKTRSRSERALRASRAKLHDSEGERKQLDKKVEELERELDGYAHALREKRAPKKVVRKYKSGTSESVALVLASDWHVEELVPPATVQGLNEYTPEIAKKRAHKFFNRLMRLVEANREQTKIETLVFWCGGDFITGHIHDENKETTAMAPLEGIDFAGGLLRAGIEFLIEHGNFKRIIIPCSFGNHGRLTRKPFTTKAAEHNLEWFMYAQLERHFENEPMVEFIVSRSRLNESVVVFDRRLRFHHGEDLKYQGGMQGVYGRLHKAHAQWNQTQACYITSVGHWHTAKAFQDLGLMNGSLIGYSAYSQMLLCQYEPPRQMFALIEKNYGMTVAAPIFVE